MLIYKSIPKAKYTVFGLIFEHYHGGLAKIVGFMAVRFKPSYCMSR
ncbi:hypothetical protein SPWS13_2294 [Shewanella putrefaciens]|nr:hypothetical protein SPWS13_2294 [Shewanella putrefaciens]